LSAPSLGVFDVNVSYDPAILQLTGVVFGDPMMGDQLDLFALGNLQDASGSAGLMTLFELSFDSVDDLNHLQADRFTLATLDFKGLSSGVSGLILTVNSFGDAEGNPLSVTTLDASITVGSTGPAAVPEPASALLVVSGVLGSWRLRKKRGGAGTGLLRGNR
jgi:hypothetical protein